MNKIIIVDGYNLFFRAFFALSQQGFVNHEGIPTNAVFAFSNMMASLLKDLNKNDAIFVALDSSKKTFRHLKYKEYKANRAKLPEELKIQFPILREYLSSLDIPFYEDEELEADDIAGIIAKMMEKNNYKVEIYTSDKDYLQLIDDKITVNVIRKGLKDVVKMTPETFFEKYEFEPKKIVDYKALAGDSSDNLKGIPGIGEKGAIKLIKEYGSFKEVLEKIDPSTSLGKKIIENQESGLLSLELATLNLNKELPLKPTDLIYQGYNLKKASDFGKKYDINNFVSRLPKKLKKESEVRNDIEYKEIESTSSLTFNQEMGLEIDLEDTNYHNAYFYGLAFYLKGDTYYISKENLLKDTNLLNALKDKKVKKYCTNFKRLKVALNQENIEINGLEFDLLLASYLLNPEVKDDPYHLLTSLEVDIKEKEKGLFEEGDKQLTSNIASYSYLLSSKLISKLEEKDQYKLLLEIEQPLTILLSEMELIGFPCQKSCLESLKEDYLEVIKKIENSIYDLAGTHDLNINSPKQLGELLFDKLNLTDYKKRSTSIEVLEKLYSEHPIIPLIIEYRKLTKTYSSYIEGILPLIDENNLIHATFNQSITQTGRLSSKEPNLQNISVKDEEGKILRKCFFFTDPKQNLLSLDYSQIELRILAHLSNAKSMIEVFDKDLDIHSETARKIFKLDREPTKNERRIAKTINFGIIYGMSDYGLAEELNISVKEAKDFIKSFFEEYPEIKIYLENVIKDCEEKHFTQTIFNRRRYLENINSTSYLERESMKRMAMNAPIQGSAADLIKIAMIKVNNCLLYNNFKARIINQIHDEIIIKVDDDEKDKVLEIAKDIMENCVKLRVKLKVEGGYAKTWYNLK